MKQKIYILTGPFLLIIESLFLFTSLEIDKRNFSLLAESMTTVVGGKHCEKILIRFIC